MSDQGHQRLPSAAKALARAAEAWILERRGEPLERWLERELDADGVPGRLSVEDWWKSLQFLTAARRERKGWPHALDARVLGLTASVLRFTRPDGSPTFKPDGLADDLQPRELLRRLVELYPKSREARVIAWMLGLRTENHVPPPLPAWSSSNRVLSSLRENWQKGGDLLVVDQSRRSPVARFELLGAGTCWLGQDWRLVNAGEATSAARPVQWLSNSVADLAEWTYRANGMRLTRTALMLRGRRMALLAEQVDAKPREVGPLETELDLAPRVFARPLEDIRGLLLGTKGVRTGVQVLPIGLPSAPYESDRGAFGVDEDRRALRLATHPRGRRCWVPLLVSWDGQRHRKRLSWRSLTISEEGRVCPPEAAFAVRVSWGLDETLVIYRSLGTPVRRTFLGHQTEARFLVGRFTREGVLEPLIAIEA